MSNNRLIDGEKIDNLPLDVQGELDTLQNNINDVQDYAGELDTRIDALTQDDIADGITYKQFSSTQETKLAGIGEGAQLVSVVAGPGTTVDNTDPQNPIVGLNPGVGFGDVLASGTLTNDTIILGGGTEVVKTSSKTIVTTLGNDDTTVPTSKAVKDIISKDPTYTTTETSSKGGLLINIDSATGDVARTTSGWIEDEKHGCYLSRQATAVSGEFDSAIRRTGDFTLKLSTTDATGRLAVFLGNNTALNPVIPCKPNTKYKLSCWVKTTTAVSNGVFVKFEEYNGTTYITQNESNKLTGTNDWTLCTITATTNANASFIKIACMNNTAGNISDAWFDINSMKLEEIIETTNDNLTTKTQGVLGFTAIGSTDNIDQSLDTGGAYANTYTLATSIVESATTIQEFVPTKSKLTQIGVWVVAKGTGNWTMTVHNSSNVVQSSITIANASLTNGAFNYFTVPANLTAGATYHFHLTSTVADGTVKSNVASDLNTCSYIEQYYKPTTAFNASLNGENIDLRADEDGFLDGAKIDLVNGKYSFSSSGSSLVNIGNIYSQIGALVIAGTPTSNGIPFPVNDSKVIKINFGLPLKDIKLSLTSLGIGGVEVQTASYSLDNVTYTTFSSFTGVDGIHYLEGNMFDGYQTVYIKISNSSAGTNYISAISIFADIDTSSIKTLYNYPTNKSNKQTYVKTLTSATTTAIYRATKYGFPAIEFTNGEYQFLKINCEATDSVVKFSADGTSYTTVTDGGSIVLSSTTLPIVYTDITITKNRLLMSSNDYNNSSDKDGSLQAGIVSIDKVQGLVYDVQDLQKEVNSLKKETEKYPMGEITYFNTTGTAITISGTSDGSTNMVKVNVASSLSHSNGLFDNGGVNNGRLRYIGETPRMFHTAVTLSGTPATTNDTFVFGVAKNGTVDNDCKIIQKFGATTDTQSTALHCAVELVKGDYVEFYVGNLTGARNVTIKTFNLFALGM